MWIDSASPDTSAKGAAIALRTLPSTKFAMDSNSKENFHEIGVHTAAAAATPPSSNRAALDADPESDAVVVRRLFAAMFVVQTAVNFDSGVVPSALVDITHTLELSFFEQGLLGAIVYIGMSASSLIAGHIFHRFNCKSVISTSVFINGIFCMIFAFAPDGFSLIVSRLFVGIAQAFVVIYGPIWVDRFAPESRKTFWMSLLYICSPLGIVLGYASGSFFHSHTSSSSSYFALWRIPLSFQGAVLLLASFLINLVPNARIDFNEDSDSVHEDVRLRHSSCEQHIESLSVFSTLSSEGRSPWFILSSNRIFVWNVLNLSVLFFVVTGIQYWITMYLIEVIHSDPAQVYIAFVFVCSTGPTTGVLFGGFLIDRCGGYCGPKQVLQTSRIDAVFGIIAVSCNILIIFMDSLPVIMGLVWMLLFTGGAIVPSLTGIIVTSVQPNLRAYASSASQLAFNVFGFAFSTLVSGTVMQLTGSKVWGFRTVLLWSLLGLVATAFAVHAAYDNLRHSGAIIVRGSSVPRLTSDESTTSDDLDLGSTPVNSQSLQTSSASSIGTGGDSFPLSV